jgi:hypothetical protein
VGESYFAATDESKFFLAFSALLFFGLLPPSSAPASFGNNGAPDARRQVGLNALHSVRSAGRRGHGQPLAM